MGIFQKTAVLLGAVLLSCGVTGFANAAVVTYSFTGVVDSIGSSLSGAPVVVGDALSGSFSYETTTAVDGPGNPAAYNALTNVHFTVGGYSAFSTDPRSIFIGNDPANDFFSVRTSAAQGLTGPPINGTELAFFQLSLSDPTSSVFSDLSLPAFLNFASFGGGKNFIVAFNGDVSPHAILGHLTDVSVAETPLPAALPLFASVLGAIGFFAHRRKRKAAVA